MDIIKKIGVCLGVVITIATGIGIYHTFINNVASADDVKRIEIKVDRYIVSQEIRQLQQRLWQIEDRYGKNPGSMPTEWRQEYRCIQRDIEGQKIKLNQIQTKGKQ